MATQDTSMTDYSFTIKLASVPEFLIANNNVPLAIVNSMIDSLVASGGPLLNERLLKWAMQRVSATLVSKVLSITTLETDLQYIHTVYSVYHVKDIAAVFLKYLLQLSDLKFEAAKVAATPARLGAFNALAQDSNYADELAQLYIRLNLFPTSVPSTDVLALCKRAGMIHQSLVAMDKIPLKAELDAANIVIDRLQKQLDLAQKAQTNGTVARLSALENVIETLQEKLQDQSNADLQDKIDCLTTELLAARGDLSQLSNELESTKTQLANAQQEIRHEASCHEDTEAELNVTYIQLKRTVDDLAEANASIKEFQKELSVVRRELNAEQTELANAHFDLRREKDNHAQTEAALVIARTDAQEAGSACALSSNEYELALRRLSEVDLEIEDAKKEFQTRLDRESSLLKNANDTIKVLSSELATAHSDMSTAQTELKTKNADITSMMTEFDNLKSKLTVASTLIKKLTNV